MLSEKQLNQRRANGRALAARVDKSYFKFLGKRGGRQFMFNMLMSNAAAYQPEPEAVASTASPAHLVRYVEAQRERLREGAEQYRINKGQRVLISLYLRDNL